MSEKDIKILEELILYYEAEAISRKFIGNLSISVNEDDIQAIENLIKGYRELEENNKQLEKCLNYYKLGDTVEEFEDLFGNVPINDIEKIKKYIFQNYIPKSKVKEKIEELEKYIYKGKNAPQDFLQYRIKAKIQALQELMED